ncbi:MAG: hypothetical protein MUD02_04630 [Bacteroidales bacterium]|jgi:hypothetical protein|nr:hypothetical protein [Bacteroidales bacterium]MCU0408217.1 hypothetical protein [Bacteroidales bacterium]
MALTIFRNYPLLFFSLLFVTLQSSDVPQGKYNFRFRGNTHTHARLSDENPANDVPEIASWYREAGYNFLCLSEHNDHVELKQLICHDEAELLPGFIMLCGNELSNERHHTALGINRYIGDETSLQDGVKKTLEAGGIPILNHPMDPPVNAADFIAAAGLYHLEVFNGGRKDETRRSEQLWDSIMSAQDGRIVYAVASDDNHYKKSNVGKGWIIVDAPELTDADILESIRNGKFYASTGIVVDFYEVSRRSVKISSSNCDSIFFVGRYGRVLRSVKGKSADYRLRGDEGYVRIKLKDTAGREAWMQPVKAL